jgi:baseplate structural protein gp10
MSDGSEKNSKGTILRIEGSYYQVKLEDGTLVSNAQNTSSVEVTVGDKVVVSYVDSLHDPVITSVFNKLSDDVTTEQVKNMIQELKQEIIEDEHPVGSPYFSFLVTDDPNKRYPGTRWVLIDEETYLVSAGSNLPGMTPVGANTHTLTTDQIPSHGHNVSIPSSGASTTGSAGAHTHTFTAVMASGATRTGTTGTLFGTDTDTTGSAGAHTHSNPNHTHTVTQSNAGSGQAHNNMPKSLAIYIWRRTA